MSNKLILSICIPTYNQPESVRAFFESIKQQISFEIEIIVRDDSPNDETKKIVEGYAARLPISVRYFKGEKSKVGGYDKALLFLTGEAKGEYLWWFGDDVLVPDAVSRIISFIKSHDYPSFVWLNARDIGNEGDRGLDLHGDKIFVDGSDLLAINVGLLGFPSITMLKRSEAILGIPGAQQFIGTTLTGYYLVLHVLAQKNKTFAFIQEPCLLSRPKPAGEVRWYDSFKIHGVNYYLITQVFRGSFNSVAMRKGLSDQFGRVWRAVVVERAMGLTTGFAAPTPKIALMTRLYWNYPEYWIALPLMIMPRKILTFLYSLYKRRGK